GRLQTSGGRVGGTQTQRRGNCGEGAGRGRGGGGRGGGGGWGGAMNAMGVATAVSREEIVQKARQFPAAAFMGYGALAAIIGAAALLRALAAGGGEAARVWQSYHFNFMFWTGLAQGLVVFAATQKLAKGHWSGLVIRFAEAAVGFLASALVLFRGLFLGRSHIFTWLHELSPDVGCMLPSEFFSP